MKTILTREFDETDDIRPYIDPLSVLSAISEITAYLRGLDKYGVGDNVSAQAMAGKIRDRVREMCEEIPEDWKQ